MNCYAAVTETRNEVTQNIRVRCYDSNGDVIYDNEFYDEEWEMYRALVVKRYEVLMCECGKLSKPYVMFEAGRRMYRLDDLDYVKNFHKFRRSVEPIDYDVEESFNFDLLLDCSLYDFFPYPEGSLVYRFGHLYINGKDLGTPIECWKTVGLDPVHKLRDVLDLDYGSGNGIKKFIAAIESYYDLKVSEFEGENCTCYYNNNKGE